jgi:hypothetical protein
MKIGIDIDIDKLKDDGNKIIIITGRDKRIFKNPKEV